MGDGFPGRRSSSTRIGGALRGARSKLRSLVGIDGAGVDREKEGRHASTSRRGEQGDAEAPVGRVATDELNDGIVVVADHD